MMGGDLGHLVVDDDTDKLLQPHFTHCYCFHDMIRFHSRSNDAPKLDASKLLALENDKYDRVLVGIY